ncbi:MAG: MarR family transcriptional regulator [Polyangiaceae bacterium]|nr:MarR family transcriptional regulator [Polyangiaceae bacterium]
MPTRYLGPKRETRALDTFIKLLRATDSVYDRLQSGLTEAGITHAQLAVLEALWHLGPMCQRELGQKLLRSGANTTAVVDTLEKRGWVARTRRADDRRVYQVALTASGKRFIQTIFPAHARRVADALSVLGSAEQEQLGRLCKKLGLALSGRASTHSDKPKPRG